MIKNGWIQHIIEFFLIIAGILLALQIDNWNENRKDRNIEIKTLKEIAQALESDQRDMSYNYELHSSAKSSCEVVLSFLEGEIIYHDSLNYHFSNATNTSTFIANTAAFETLKSRGVHLIRNDSLRLTILNLYDVRYEYQKWMDLWTATTYSQEVLPLALNTFDEVELFKPWKPLDLTKLKNDQSYKNLIFFTKSIRNFDTNLMKNSLSQLERIRAQINAEIIRLES